MKAIVFALCLTLGCLPMFGQNAEVKAHANWFIVLMSGQKDVDSVMPMSCNDKTHHQLKFVSMSKIMDSQKNGCIALRFGDVSSALAESSQTIKKLQSANAALQAENAKLWKVAEKDSPQPQPPTVVVQQPAPVEQPNPEADKETRRQQMIRSWLMMQNENRPQNYNVNVYNCTKYPALCAGR